MSEPRQGIDPYHQSCFSLQNRLLRLLWGIVWLFAFRPSPRPFHSWRAFLLRCFGADLGHACHVYPSAKIWAPWNLEMDDESSLGDNVNCYSMGKVSLGARAIVSQGTHLCTGTHDYQSKDFRLYTKPITIGAGAWVCAEAFIHPGVNIGEGCVIGARSVVSKDMPEWMVCSGHPCRPCKPREQTTT